jgi:hypothetical protein
LGRPIAAPLERCAELLGVDLATVRELAAEVEPYLRADGTRIWSLMQLERQLRPEHTAGVGAATSTVDGTRLPMRKQSGVGVLAYEPRSATARGQAVVWPLACHTAAGSITADTAVELRFWLSAGHRC